jgi:steroid delta-isomerase-like uncharacterized protein
MDDLRGIVAPFYTRCLTVNQDTNVAEAMGQLLADDFQSRGTTDVKTREQLIGQVQGFWQLVPDLKWDVREMLQDGNRVIVRSVASGTPRGDFMGVRTSGERSFEIMTIDIHRVEGGRVTEVYHLEDWPTAIRQLSS